jgi:hypothetical protein
MILGIIIIVMAFFDCTMCLYVMLGGILILILALAIYSYQEYFKGESKDK